MRDVADDPKYADVRERLVRLLIQNLYGGDLGWLDGDRLVGLPDNEWSPKHDYGLSHGNQRGYRFR